MGLLSSLLPLVANLIPGLGPMAAGGLAGAGQGLAARW